MVSIELTAEHGKCIAVALALWIQQQLIFAIRVAMARSKSGIQPPTLYPRDSEIKALNLTEKDVDSYMCVQRVHQVRYTDRLLSVICIRYDGFF